MTQPDAQGLSVKADDKASSKQSYLLSDAGFRAYHEGDYEKALELLMKSLDLKKHAITYKRLYIVLRYGYRGRYAEAFWHLEQSYNLQPGDTDAAIRYAEELVHQGKAQQAKGIVERILTRHKTHGPALRLLNRIENPEAADFSVEPDDLVPPEEEVEEPYAEDYVLYLEGVDAWCKGEPEKALELLLKSVQIYAHGSTHEWLYTVLKYMGKSEEAFLHIEQAAQLSSNNNKILTLYAEALVERGESEKAKLVLDSVLHRSTTYGPARKLLKQIETGAG